MKLLMVYEQTSKVGGGDQLATKLWYRNLKKQGIECKFLTDVAGPQNLQEFPEDDYITIKAVSLSPVLPNYSLSLSLSKEVKEQILAFHPDIIHIEQQLPLSNDLLHFAKKHQIAILTSFHTAAKDFIIKKFPLNLFVRHGGIYNRFIDIFQFSMFSKSDAITVPSHEYEMLAKKRITVPVYVVSSPVAASAFQEKTSYAQIPKKLLSVSRMSSEKRVDVLIDMMHYLKDTCTLTLVGGGVDKEVLEQKAKTLGLSDVITFAGRVDNDKLQEIYHDHDLYLSASDFETFGMTYIEALGSRIPVVAFDYPVSREVIPNEMAVFVKTLDPKDWATAIQQLQTNPDIYKQLTTNIQTNYQEVEKYSEAESTKRLIEVYQKLLTPQKNHPSV